MLVEVIWVTIVNNVTNCDQCNKYQPGLIDFTKKWNDRPPWERLDIDGLYGAKRCSILIPADAESVWIVAFPCTGRLMLIKCICHIRVCPITVKSLHHKGTETVECCIHREAMAERDGQTLKSLGFYTKNIGCSLSTHFD